MNDRGELVGINTAILSHGSGGNEGIGFAVPVKLWRVRGGDDPNSRSRQGESRRTSGIMVQDVTPGDFQGDGPQGL